METSQSSYTHICLLAIVTIGSVVCNFSLAESLVTGGNDANVTLVFPKDVVLQTSSESQAKGNTSNESVLSANDLNKKNAVSLKSGQNTYNSAPVEHLDGRSASYSSSLYSDSRPDATPPLYKLLQQQMEQVLATTGSEYGLYNGIPKQGLTHTSHKKNHRRHDNTREAGQDKDMEDFDDIAVQTPPKKPLFEYGNNEDVEDYAEETVAESDGDDDPTGYGLSFPSTTTHKSIPTRPVTSLKNSTAATTLKTTTTRHPTIQAADVPAPLHSTSNATTSAEKKQKRRIVFKTVATASQFVSTPLADLMLKFSIGLAKPSHPITDNFQQPSIGSEEVATDPPNAIEKSQNTPPSPVLAPYLLSHSTETAKSASADGSLKHHRQTTRVHGKKKSTHKTVNSSRRV